MLLCRLGSDAELHVCFRGDAHRESGVYQLCFGSKPGGVMLPPELKELTPHVYSWNGKNASEELENPGGCGGIMTLEAPGYFMKRDSRNWSRPINDFMVR